MLRPNELERERIAFVKQHSRKVANQEVRLTWGKRKRWIVLGVLWLLFAYPAGLGPLCYFHARGWMGAPVANIIGPLYAPLGYFVINDIPPGASIREYTEWWEELGKGHAMALE